jgi:hypothetical protein
MENNEEEAKEQPKQTSVKDHVLILIKAHELAKIASSIKVNVIESDRETLIFFNDGKDTTTNPTLAHYLERAEKMVLADHPKEIIKTARQLLENEIESIKELLNV